MIYLDNAATTYVSSEVLNELKQHADITIYYYNPNITSELEYEKRYVELQNFLITAYGNKVKLIKKD